MTFIDEGGNTSAGLGYESQETHTPVEAPVEAASAPEDLIDPESYGDFKVPVTVAGETRLVPLNEVRNGFMMQSDYTQKTQQLAAERARLAQAERLMYAFEQDPQSTLQALSQAFGDGDDTDIEDIDPEEIRLRNVESFMEEQRQRELDNFITSQVQGLKAQHGEFDENELFGFMVQSGIKDFETAFGAMQWKSQQARARADQQATDAKRTLPPVAGGRGVAAGAVVPGATQPVNSIREAFELAQRQLGLA